MPMDEHINPQTIEQHHNKQQKTSIALQHNHTHWGIEQLGGAFGVSQIAKANLINFH